MVGTSAKSGVSWVAGSVTIKGRGRITVWEEPGSWVHFSCPRFLVLWMLPLWMVGRGPESWMPPQLAGWGYRPQCSCYLVLCGHRHLCSYEARYVYTASPGATRFLDCGLSHPGCFQDHRHCFWYSPGSASSMCCSPPTFRCMEFSYILLCWAESSLLSCRCFIGCILKGRERGSVSICHDDDVTTDIYVSVTN